MSVKFANNAHSTLASSVSTSATSITVASGQGARFPSLSSGEYFYATLIDTSNNLEIVKVTARSTDVLTATRAQESTTARAFSSGDRIELRVTAQGLVDATTIQADQVVNSMIATDAVNADSIVANAVGASEINVSGNGNAGQALLSDGDGTFSFGQAGQIGQVLFSSSSAQTTVSSGSNSYVDVTGCSVTITPASSSSRFFLTTAVQQYSSGNGGGYGHIRLTRTVSGGSLQAVPFNPGNSHGAGNGSGDPYSFNGLVCVDSPATTSQITYKTQVSSYTGGTTKTNSPTGSAANLMVMEILT